MQVNVTTREFELSHGRRPRGAGLWMFRLDWTLADNRRERHHVEAHGAYSDALREARDEARVLAPEGAVAVEVAVQP